MRNWILIAIAAVFVGAILFGCAQALPPTDTAAVVKNLTIDQMVAATGTAMAAQPATPAPKPIGQPINDQLYNQAGPVLAAALAWGLAVLIFLYVITRIIAPVLNAVGQMLGGCGTFITAFAGLSTLTVLILVGGGNWAVKTLVAAVSPLGLVDSAMTNIVVMFAMLFGIPAVVLSLAAAKRIAPQPQQQQPPPPPQ